MMIFKIAPSDEWLAAMKAGSYSGTAKDKADGFLHFSTAEQLCETLRLHYAGAKEMLAVAAVDVELLSGELRWEAARDGQLFPHLYDELPVAAVKHVIIAFTESLMNDDFEIVREFVDGRLPPARE